jgi:Family of unknown function (DUF6978)
MLSQAEADTLIQMRKRFLRPVAIRLPPGTDQSNELVGDDPREHFLLDLWRGRIRLTKVKYQTRDRSVIVLVRLCLDFAPHPNPDGSMVGRNHLHVYREGYGDKWAIDLDPSQFPSPSDMWDSLTRFCEYCNISPIPPMEPELA